MFSVAKKSQQLARPERLLPRGRRRLDLVSMSHVRVQISRAQVSSFAAPGSLLSASVDADEDRAESGLLDAGERVLASRAVFVRRVFCAVEAKHVFAGNQPTVDQNRQIAFLARVNRRIRHFLR